MVWSHSPGGHKPRVALLRLAHPPRLRCWRMKFVTWNIDGLDVNNCDERTEAAVFISIIGSTLDDIHTGKTKPQSPPDVIVYQEVVERTIYAHLLPHLTAGGYVVVPNEVPQRQTFEIVAVREPYSIRTHTMTPLVNSQFGRVLHIVEVTGPSGNVRVLTGHFDSGPDSGAIRASQMHQVAKALGPRGVFGGDTNMRKAEWLAAKESVEMIDAWEQLGEPASTRATWFLDNMKARFDRVWIGSELRATSMKPLGDKPLSELSTRPSDHNGLVVEIEIPTASN
jgi:endonuclease/exonuclease/phosphatase family metal-dependent hydrolase